MRNLVFTGGPARVRWEGLPGKTGGTQDPATGSVGGLLGQTGRLGLATERSAREERGGRVLSDTLRAGPSRPWRRTRGSEEPPARTPARGRPAGALRWRVTFANRSVYFAGAPRGAVGQRTAENRSSELAVPAQASQTASPGGRPQVPRSLGAAVWRSVFPKTGFLKS